MSIPLLGSSFLFSELLLVETPRSWSDVNRSGLPRPAGAGCFAPWWRSSLACSPSGDEGTWWWGGVVAGLERARDRIVYSRSCGCRNGKMVVAVAASFILMRALFLVSEAPRVGAPLSWSDAARPSAWPGPPVAAVQRVGGDSPAGEGLVRVGPSFPIGCSIPLLGIFVVGAARRARTDVRDFGRC